MPKLMSLQFLIKAGRIRWFIHSVCFWVQHRSGCCRHRDHGPQVKLYRVGFGAPVQCLFFCSVGSIQTASYVEIRIPAVRNQTCSERSAYSTTTAHELLAFVFFCRMGVDSCSIFKFGNTWKTRCAQCGARLPWSGRHSPCHHT